MLKNKSVPVDTIDGVELIELSPSDMSPLVSQCTIKVMYLGKNRNGSYIDKSTAVEMAKSIRSCPIVGAWREDVEDFGDHGHVITIEDGEIKFACKTVPYGFVAPDARVWFQKFVDTDEFGNDVEREYMMTTGYLWTGQFEEAKKIIEEGAPQSMELDESTLKGSWANDAKTGMDFFIINDAIFSKLCVLGDDVEPCFEGASITAGVDSNYSEPTEFAHTLFSMIKQLQDMIGTNEGGMYVSKPEKLEEKVATDFVAGSGDNKELEDAKKKEADGSNAEKEVAPSDEAAEDDEEKKEEAPKQEHALIENSVVESVKKEDDAPKDEDDSKDGEDVEPESADGEEEPVADDSSDESDKDEDKKASKYECASNESEDEATSVNFALEQENEKLREELEALRQFKLSIENEQKDALIAKYHMLSDDDKADVIAHKEEYTLEQIDEKLALIYVRKNVDFSTIDGHHEEGVDVDSILSFSLDDNKDAEVVSDIQAAFRSM